MRRTTAMMAPWQAQAQTGESLTLEACKGGYFSTDDAYGLKVVGKTAQNGTPTPENPVAIQCVKAGTVITCGDCEITTPCDLYEGDIWYPMTGKVERHKRMVTLDGTEEWQIGGHYLEDGEDYYYQLTPYTDSEYNGNAAVVCTHYPHNTISNNTVTQGCNLTWGSLRIRWGEEMPIEAWKQHLADMSPHMQLVYRLATPVTEQYDPQPISAPQGTVHVMQVPSELTAELSATMLVRRNA